MCACVQFKLLMEHLDPDEEEEEGEASAAVRNKAITALLGVPGGGSPRNHHTHDSEDEDSEGDERTPGVRHRHTHCLHPFSPSQSTSV